MYHHHPLLSGCTQIDEYDFCLGNSARDLFDVRPSATKALLCPFTHNDELDAEGGPRRKRLSFYAPISLPFRRIPPFRRGTCQIFPLSFMGEVAVFGEDILEPVITVVGEYLYIPVGVG